MGLTGLPVGRLLTPAALGRFQSLPLERGGLRVVRVPHEHFTRGPKRRPRRTGLETLTRLNQCSLDQLRTVTPTGPFVEGVDHRTSQVGRLGGVRL